MAKTISPRRGRNKTPWPATAKMAPMRDPKSILITGASSGIGEALALGYAAHGVDLAISGREAGRLDGVAEACRAKGAEVRAATIDVTDRDAMTHWIAGTDGAAPLDLVVANAGISAGTGSGGESAEQARRLFEVNLQGVLNTVHPAIEAMRRRGKGQVAMVSSVASFLPLPGSPAYAASKAAVRLYGESLRGALAPDGIEVSVICPGFVESRMTASNPYPMPFIMPAAKAARIIRRGLARNRARIAFPWPTYFISWFLGALPPALTDPLLRRLPKKP